MPLNFSSSKRNVKKQPGRWVNTAFQTTMMQACC